MILTTYGSLWSLQLFNPHNFFFLYSPAPLISSESQPQPLSVSSFPVPTHHHHVRHHFRQTPRPILSLSRLTRARAPPAAVARDEQRQAHVLSRHRWSVRCWWGSSILDRRCFFYGVKMVKFIFFLFFSFFFSLLTPWCMLVVKSDFEFGLFFF